MSKKVDQKIEKSLDGSTCRHADLEQGKSDYNRIKDKQIGAEIQDRIQNCQKRSFQMERRKSRLCREVRSRLTVRDRLQGYKKYKNKEEARKNRRANSLTNTKCTLLN